MQTYDSERLRKNTAPPIVTYNILSNLGITNKVQTKTVVTSEVNSESQDLTSKRPSVLVNMLMVDDYDDDLKEIEQEEQKH